MQRSLDKIDNRLLLELRHDARLSHQELSERVGLSPTPCSRRIRILEKEGYIKGYFAKIDEAMMGFGFTVFVSVQLDFQTEERILSFEKAINVLPEVVDCWLMTGNRDYLLRLALSDLKEFERFLTRKLTKIDGVASIESSIPIRSVKEQGTRVL